MSITGSQFQQLHDVLHASFELELDFDALVAPGSRSERVFNLVTWAKRNERSVELIAAAYNRNPTNRAVQKLVQEAQGDIASAKGYDAVWA